MTRQLRVPVDDDGWIGGQPYRPPFECARLLRAPGGTTFLKVLEAGLEFAVKEY